MCHSVFYTNYNAFILFCYVRRIIKKWKFFVKIFLILLVGHIRQHSKPPKSNRFARNLKPSNRNRLARNLKPPKRNRFARNLKPPNRNRLARNLKLPKRNRFARNLKPPNRNRLRQFSIFCFNKFKCNKLRIINIKEPPKKIFGGSEALPHSRQSLNLTD